MVRTKYLKCIAPLFLSLCKFFNILNKTLTRDRKNPESKRYYVEANADPVGEKTDNT
jgi:hypothetical protein